MPTKSDLSVTQFIFHTVKPYKKNLTFFGVAAFFWAVINTLLPFSIKKIIDTAVAFQGHQSSIFFEILSIDDNLSTESSDSWHLDSCILE